MNTDNIIEGNKLIAEFMGAVFIEPTGHLQRNVQLKEAVDYLTLYNEQNLKYHTSWDWLMPVCKKCYDIWITKHREDERCAEIFDCLWSGMWHFNIEETWEYTVEFIQWYNKNKS